MDLAESVPPVSTVLLPASFNVFVTVVSFVEVKVLPLLKDTPTVSLPSATPPVTLIESEELTVLLEAVKTDVVIVEPLDTVLSDVALIAPADCIVLVAVKFEVETEISPEIVVIVLAEIELEELLIEPTLISPVADKVELLTVKLSIALPTPKTV